MEQGALKQIPMQMYATKIKIGNMQPVYVAPKDSDHELTVFAKEEGTSVMLWCDWRFQKEIDTNEADFVRENFPNPGSVDYACLEWHPWRSGKDFEDEFIANLIMI